MGVVLAGGDLTALNPWLALLAGLLIMAGGHSFNSLLDYSWTGLDKGELESRSAEKGYTGGQSVIAAGIVSPREVYFNAVSWYLLALVPLVILSVNSHVLVFFIGFFGMAVTFWYSIAKFNWTHELALGVGVGPIPVLIGMFAVNPSPPWLDGLIASVPIAIVLSFAGLALDEWPDAEANLKKGVKSIAYKVWEHNIPLSNYLMWWIAALYIYQMFLIIVGVFVPLTGITFVLVPFLIAFLAMMEGDFEKFSPCIVVIAACYPILLLLGQALGGG